MENNKRVIISPLILSNVVEEDAEFVPIITDDDDDEMNRTKIPDTIPLLPLKNTVLFPGVLIPITVGREKSIRTVKHIYKKNKIIGAISQKDFNIDDPASGDLFHVGTVAQIIKVLDMPDDSTSIIIQGKKRFRVKEHLSSDPYFIASVEALNDVKPLSGDQEFDAIVSSIKDLSLKIIKLSSHIPQEAAFAIKNIENTSFLINFISSNTDINVIEKQKLLETDDLKERAKLLLQHLAREVQMQELKNEVQLKVRSELEQQQREFLLNQQIKTIQEELGGNPLDREIEDMKKRVAEKKWGKDKAETFEKELEKLQRLHPAAGEYSVQLNYLHLLLELPWNEYTVDNFDMKNARNILDEDHYGLEKIKERILEHLAVLKLKGDLKSPILCLYGPPGVGKTSLGKSVARALGRKYCRMSLGGLHDESEIRGHRKTYIGAMPGRILQNIKKAKTSNPVFVLDEIDKIGHDFKGDPSFALLEVLDPEQNIAFYDNYLELEYDLSRVLFIATANTTTTINPALRDRMEIINVTGYIVEEKIEIARKHLVPKQLEAHGVNKKQMTIPRQVMEMIIEDYTRESGVRELDQKIAKVVRNIAKKIAFEEEYNIKITPDDLREYLGPPEYIKDIYDGNDIPGIVTGLAWTAAGGEILYVETSLSPGKGKLTLTGNLGDVMKESATLALEYLKAHGDKLGISQKMFEEHNVHVHVPEGAIPKDGPSAGITMVASLASAFTRRKVRKSIAMTGEITLRGKVLPVGGIKEKILAAKRVNIKEIILSEDNRKDIEQINELYLKGLNFRYVKNIMEMIEFSLLKQKAMQ
ncbi:MAG: endopeptidase La [Bacteroidetes bacterium]|nr:endopeptidase La [Bacteroidota bacterium]